jgi:Retroviral aspartyl protease
MHTLERNTSKPKDFRCIVPRVTIVECHINGHAARALLDSGSLSDFISTTLVDQLKLKAEHLAKPITCQMAATGSRTMITSSVEPVFAYQGIEELWRFDVINLENHDVILGTPFLWQHKVILGFNPPKLSIGSVTSLPIAGEGVARISSLATDLAEEAFEKLQKTLKNKAWDLCVAAEDMPLPPLQVMNHHIPIIDENKIYAYRPS